MFFVDNFFIILFGASESVFTFVTLLEGKAEKSKSFSGYCKQENLFLPLHSQIEKGDRNRKDFPG
jgi:hypothetical protein